MNNLRRRVKSLEQALSPKEPVEIVVVRFVWRHSNQTEEEALKMAGIDPDIDREQIVFCGWEGEDEFDQQGPVEPIKGNFASKLSSAEPNLRAASAISDVGQADMDIDQQITQVIGELKKEGFSETDIQALVDCREPDLLAMFGGKRKWDINKS
jgi:hypothetical protein